MKHYCDNYKDALAIAQKIAKQQRITVPLKRENGRWCLELPSTSIATSQSLIFDSSQNGDAAVVSRVNPKPRITKPKGASKKNSLPKNIKPLRKPNPPYLKPAVKSPKSSVKERPLAQQVTPPTLDRGPRQDGRSRSVKNGIRERELIAMKIFQLGQGIAKSGNGAYVIELIKAELDRLDALGAFDERPIFFNLLLAEIYREMGDPLPYRKAAQESAELLGSGIFDAYMEIAQATLTKASADEFTGQGVVKGSVASRRVVSSQGQWGQSRSWVVDNVLGAFNLSEDDLSDTQRLYLEKTTLKQIIDAGVLIPS